ncbi:MAG: hypothetical protein V4733_03770 [Verrucomicrobiota bacterium]
MLRSDAIRAIQEFLIAEYNGPITILSQEDDAEKIPPYAIVRAGSAENSGMNQYDIWDINILVAVFHDADATTVETAEEQAAQLFDLLADPAQVAAYLSPKIVASWWEPLTVEASIMETHWSHVAGFRLVAAPADG